MAAIQAAFRHAHDTGRELPVQSSPEPTTTFSDALDLEIGGRRVQLRATPGGETTCSLVVWLPECRTALTGNMLGPLFGHVPNLVTIRGDRYRDALAYIDSLRIVAVETARPTSFLDSSGLCGERRPASSPDWGLIG